MLGKTAVRIGRPPKRALLFRADAPFRKLSATFTAPNGHNHLIEVMGDGQQIVVNGIHPDTRQPYRWHGGEPGPKLRREDLPLLTAEAATAFLVAATKLLTARGWTLADNKKSNGTANHGSRARVSTTIRERTYARAALEGCAEELAATPPGDRNNILYKKAFRIGTMVGRGWLPRSDAEADLFDAAAACGLIADDGEAQVRKTIASGLDGGMTQPHADLDERAQACDDNSVDDGDFEDAAQAEMIEPLPLFPPLPPAAPFPVEALGNILAKAANAIARKVQVSAVIAAQSVLAAAALAAQATANVMMPFGDIRPLSLSFISILPSGGRKTTADASALQPIRAYEGELKEAYDAEMEHWDVEQATWKAERRKIEGDKKIDRITRKYLLTQLGPEPPPPLQPFLTAAEPTIEGLIKTWVNAPAALGIFSAEGGQFIGGYGMSPDHRLKTAAFMSSMWDGTKHHYLRAGAGSIILEGRRLSVHLMVQPDAAAEFLSDPILRNQGLLSRILAAQPDSLAGTRLYRDTEEDDLETIRDYSRHILKILQEPWPLAEGERNVLAPPALIMETGAFEAWKKFYDDVERRCDQSGEFATIEDFAAKAAEQAARIAGVLTVVADYRAKDIAAATMRDAVKIAAWYVNETRRLQQGGRTDPMLVRAQRLLDWLRTRGSEVDVREILRLGPPAERSKKAAEQSLAILRSHGWVKLISKRPYRVSVVQASTQEMPMTEFTSRGVGH